MNSCMSDDMVCSGTERCRTMRRAREPRQARKSCTYIASPAYMLQELIAIHQLRAQSGIHAVRPYPYVCFCSILKEWRIDLLPQCPTFHDSMLARDVKQSATAHHTASIVSDARHVHRLKAPNVRSSSAALGPTLVEGLQKTPLCHGYSKRRRVCRSGEQVPKSI